MGNNSWTHPPFVSRHLVLQNLRNINFLDFSMFDALDACLMVHGSWLKAHGSCPREARGGSWLIARSLPVATFLHHRHKIGILVGGNGGK